MITGYALHSAAGQLEEATSAFDRWALLGSWARAGARLCGLQMLRFSVARTRTLLPSGRARVNLDPEPNRDTAASIISWRLCRVLLGRHRLSYRSCSASRCTQPKLWLRSTFPPAGQGPCRSHGEDRPGPPTKPSAPNTLNTRLKRLHPLWLSRSLRPLTAPEIPAALRKKIRESASPPDLSR